MNDHEFREAVRGLLMHHAESPLLPLTTVQVDDGSYWVALLLDGNYPSQDDADEAAKEWVPAVAEVVKGL